MENDNEAAELLNKVQTFVARDLNSQIPPWINNHVSPNDVHILSFTRVFGSWTAVASTCGAVGVIYMISHDAENNQTHSTFYSGKPSKQIVI